MVPGFEEKPVPGDDPVDDGNDDTGDDNTGDDNTGGDNPGDDNTGTQEPAGIVLTWEDNPDFEPVYISADLDATLIINATRGSESCSRRDCCLNLLWHSITTVRQELK